MQADPLYRQIRDGVTELDTQHGREFDATSERMTASLLVLAKNSGLTRVDHVVLSNATSVHPTAHNVFVVQESWTILPICVRSCPPSRQ